MTAAVVSAAARWYALTRRTDSDALQVESVRNARHTVEAVSWMLDDLADRWLWWRPVHLPTVSTWQNIQTPDGRRSAALCALEVAQGEIAAAAAELGREYMRQPGAWDRPAWFAAARAAELWNLSHWYFLTTELPSAWCFALSATYKAALSGAVLTDRERAEHAVVESAAAFVEVAERWIGVEPVSERRSA